jgi:4-hydroxy-tetrahydrodipicolinate synthase
MEKLHGIVVPMVTPLTLNAEIDYNATEKLVEHLISGGVHGIFVLGTTGEAQSLSAAQRESFVKFVGKYINGRTRYIVGVSDTSIADSVKLAAVAKAAGAEGVVATPPYYFAPSQSDMVNWFTALADASPLPVYMYNMPSHVKVNIDPATVAKLASHPNIKGLKDSSHNMTYFQTLAYLTRDEEDFVLFVGPEEQTAQAVLLGGAGGVNGGANMFPELYVKSYNAAVAGDLETVKKCQKAILHISTAIYNVDGYLPGLKGALELLGLCGRTLALPYTAMSDDKMVELKAALEGISNQEWN